MRIILTILLLTIWSNAHAAETTLPIKTRIIDCTTKEKAQYYCDKERKCCGVHGAINR